MLITIGLVTNQVAVAQTTRDYRYDDRYDDRVRWDEARERRYAYLLGYHNGYSEGRDHRFHRISYKDMPSYRDGMNGWLAWMGDRGTYRKHYRDGYEEGFKDGQNGRNRRYDRDDVERVLGGDLKGVYDDGFPDRGRGRGHGRNDGRYDDGYGGRFDRDQVYRIAQQNGYNLGVRHGQEDRARRRGYDFDHSSQYRDASSGYRSEYGNRDFYRQAFREGYRRGYDEGYRRGDGRSRWPF